MADKRKLPVYYFAENSIQHGRRFVVEHPQGYCAGELEGSCSSLVVAMDLFGFEPDFINKVGPLYSELNPKEGFYDKLTKEEETKILDEFRSERQKRRANLAS